LKKFNWINIVILISKQLRRKCLQMILSSHHFNISCQHLNPCRSLLTHLLQHCVNQRKMQLAQIPEMCKTKFNKIILLTTHCIQKMTIRKTWAHLNQASTKKIDPKTGQDTAPTQQRESAIAEKLIEWLKVKTESTCFRIRKILHINSRPLKRDHEMISR
jgi:hypothetical protein